MLERKTLQTLRPGSRLCCSVRATVTPTGHPSVTICIKHILPVPPPEKICLFFGLQIVLNFPLVCYNRKTWSVFFFYHLTKPIFFRIWSAFLDTKPSWKWLIISVAIIPGNWRQIIWFIWWTKSTVAPPMCNDKKEGKPKHKICTTKWLLFTLSLF